jgi:hypothetical protein
MSLERKNEDEAANSGLERNSYTSGWVCTGAGKGRKTLHTLIRSDLSFRGEFGY